MSAMFQDMMDSQINQPHIKRMIFRHQGMAKMVNGRIFFIISFVVKIHIIKKAVCLVHRFVFLIQPTFIQSFIKAGILFADFLGK